MTSFECKIRLLFKVPEQGGTIIICETIIMCWTSPPQSTSITLQASSSCKTSPCSVQTGRDTHSHTLSTHSATLCHTPPRALGPCADADVDALATLQRRLSISDMGPGPPSIRRGGHHLYSLNHTFFASNFPMFLNQSIFFRLNKNNTPPYLMSHILSYVLNLFDTAF